MDAFCDPTRIKIMHALRDTTLAASELAHVIGRSRSATSQRLRVLRETRERRGIAQPWMLNVEKALET